MNRKPGFIIVLGILICLAGGVWLYDWVLGRSEEASEPIRADPIAEVDRVESNSLAAAESRVTFEIVSESSEVRFIIFEELRGEPVDVVGASNQVAGQFLVDFSELSESRMGPIRINARTFVTDEERRDRATRNRILHTDDYEYILFFPVEISGLNGAIQTGDTLDFTLHGDLTIRDITQPATFEATMTLDENNLITAEARTMISRQDYNLIVPNLPFLANVAEEVRLEFEGTLQPVSDSDNNTPDL